MYPANQWENINLGGVGFEFGEPEDWRTVGLPNYGAFAETMGVMSDDNLPPMAVEVDQHIYDGVVGSSAPLIELTPKDYNYVRVLRRPYDGMMGLGEDGQIYEYDGNLGFFKKLFRRAKRAVRRVGRRIASGVKRVVRKLPGGKFLLKMGSKLFKVATKLVKPLTKLVGRYAAKLAPVAALIPGYGPAIAAGLYTAGKVANLMNKYGVKLTGAAGAVRGLKFPSASVAKKFKRKLTQAARAAASKRR